MKPLVMFCAAGMKAPVSEIAKQYEEECGVEVQIQYGGSGALLSSLSVGVGDVYLAADSSYLQRAKASGLVAEVMPVAFLRAGLGVPVGNPLGVKSNGRPWAKRLAGGVGQPGFFGGGSVFQKNIEPTWDVAKGEPHGFIAHGERPYERLEIGDG